MKEMVPEWIVFALLAAISIGLTNIASNNLARQLGKTGFKIEQVTPLLGVIALIIIISYFGFYQRVISVELVKALLIVFSLSLVTMILTLNAFSKGQTSLVSTVLLLNIIVTVGVSVLLLGETLSSKQIAGIIVTTLGVFLLV